jgi:hypothetical protein
MTRLSSLIILSATAIALSSPALAKTSIQKGENLCKSEVAKLEPAPKSVRVDKEGARASNDTFVFDVKARNAENASIKMTCTVDRENDTASVALLSPLGDQQQQAAQ